MDSAVKWDLRLGPGRGEREIIDYESGDVVVLIKETEAGIPELLSDVPEMLQLIKEARVAMRFGGGDWLARAEKVIADGVEAKAVAP